MSDKTYGVIERATGKVGTIALRHFVENPSYELEGEMVTCAAKAGTDAGELAGVHRLIEGNPT